jgi:virulence factor Mce-like protein
MPEMQQLRSSVNGVIDHPWVLIGAAALIAFVVWAAGTRSQDHHVRVAFDTAVSIAPGLDVQANGVDVGKVSKVSLEDGRSIVEIGIDDESVWPLKQGTKAGIRFGSTIGNGTRRVEIFPSATGPDIPDGGIIANDQTQVPTEFDEVFQTLGPHTRADLSGGQKRLGAVVRGRGKRIATGIRSSSRALEPTSALLRELASDGTAITEFVDHTDAVTRTLAGHRPQISALLTVANQTFATFAANTGNLQAVLDRTPGTLAEARTTLARINPTLDHLDALATDIAPGSRALRPLAARARPAFADLRDIAPVALRTVRNVRRAAPAIDQLLRRATPFANDVTPALAGLAPIASCIRPYAPELAGFLSNWSSFSKNVDVHSNYARIRAVVSETAFNDVPNIPTSALTSVAGTTYAGLRPPGLNAGQPWFMPECGVGKDVVDPGKDWEDTK